MTEKQALKRAKKMYGKSATVQDSGGPGRYVKRYRVGAILMGFFDCAGHGDTWEEAFESARKSKKPMPRPSQS